MNAVLRDTSKVSCVPQGCYCRQLHRASFCVNPQGNVNGQSCSSKETSTVNRVLLEFFLLMKCDDRPSSAYHEPTTTDGY